MFLKTTLCGSNPRVIREFYIEDDRTVEELLQTIAILHGWDFDSPLELVLDDRTVDKAECLTEIFDPGMFYEDCYAQMPMEKPRYYYSSFTDTKWRFRIQLIEEKEKKDQICLLRYRGIHPYAKATSVRENNELMEHIIWYGTATSRLIGSVDVKCQKVNVESINKTLVKRIVLKQEELILDESRALPLDDILDYAKVEHLKDIIKMNGLKINTGQRKSKLLKEIKEAYCKDEFWLHLLDRMGLKEYAYFKNLCFGRKNPSMHLGNDLTTISDYGLLLSDHRDYVVPEELLHFYGKYMEENGDEELIYRKKLNRIMNIANQLYGIYTKPMCKKIASILYPDEVNAADLSKVWHKGPGRKLFNAFVMFNTRDLYEDKVFEIIRGVEIDTPGAYYVPTKEELEEIDEHGLNYPMRERKELERLIRSFRNRLLFFDEEVSGVVQIIYHYCHVGYQRNFIERFLFEDLEMEGTKGQKKRLLDTIEKFLGKVRTIEFHGYNLDEMRVRNVRR